jgi:hypothetical protein
VYFVFIFASRRMKPVGFVLRREEGQRGISMEG